MMSYTPIWVSWAVKKVSQKGNCWTFYKISLSKRTTKTMEERGPSFQKIFFSDFAVTWFIFKKLEMGHIGVTPHHHTIMGTKEKVQGRWARRVEVGGGDLGGGWVRGELAPFVFYFPEPLAFFGFSPLTFLIRAKMHKSKKRHRR